MRTLSGLVAIATVLAGAPLDAAEVYVDEFDGDNLAEVWEVSNPNPDGYIVENGALVVISTGPGNLADGSVPNVFQLDQALPDGNWTLTLQFSAELQTARERIDVGLLEGPDRYLTAYIRTGGDKYYGWWMTVGASKVQKDKSAFFETTVARLGCNVCRADRQFANFAEQIKQPILLKLEKQGHYFMAAAKLAGPDAQWIETPQLTLLREGGKLTLFVNQESKTSGETLYAVDWIRIETP